WTGHSPRLRYRRFPPSGFPDGKPVRRGRFLLTRLLQILLHTARYTLLQVPESSAGLPVHFCAPMATENRIKAPPPHTGSPGLSSSYPSPSGRRRHLSRRSDVPEGRES